VAYLEGFEVTSPTEKQIDFVEAITEVLGIDFPQSSKEFTKQIYFEFIKEHHDKWKDKTEWCSWYEDEMDWFQMLNG
jgi:hypothetical protein